jgi:hypothetical protein
MASCTTLQSAMRASTQGPRQRRPRRGRAGDAGPRIEEPDDKLGMELATPLPEL